MFPLAVLRHVETINKVKKVYSIRRLPAFYLVKASYGADRL
jgi:hypothetical protein